MNKRNQSEGTIVDYSTISTPISNPVSKKINVSQAYWQKDQTVCTACSLSG